MRDDFTQSEWAEFYTLLLKRKEAIKTALRQHEDTELKELSYDNAGERAPTRFHQADQASFTADEETYSDLVSRDIRKLQEVEDALERMETDRFGICQRCEEKISVKRLLNIPEARFCRNCEGEIERNQKRSLRSSNLQRRDFSFR